MNELTQQAGTAFEQAQELMSVASAKETVTEILDWIAEKVFSNKNTTKQKLTLIKQQKADHATIDGLKLILEFVLEDNEELQQELAEKLQEIDKLAADLDITIPKVNTATITGNGKIVIQDVQGHVSLNFGNGAAENDEEI